MNSNRPSVSLHASSFKQTNWKGTKNDLILISLLWLHCGYQFYLGSSRNNGCVGDSCFQLFENGWVNLDQSISMIGLCDLRYGRKWVINPHINTSTNMRLLQLMWLIMPSIQEMVRQTNLYR